MKVKDLIKVLKKYDGNLVVEVLGKPYLSKSGRIKSVLGPVMGLGYTFDGVWISSEYKSNQLDQGQW